MAVGDEADEAQSTERVLLSPVTAQCPGQAASTHHPLLIFAAPVQAGCMSLHSVLG